MSDVTVAEATLAPRSPLQSLATLGRHGRATGTAGVTIREIQNVQIAGVIACKGRAAGVAKALSALAGAEINDAPGHVGTVTLAVTGIAPGQWLVTRRAQPNANLAGALATRLANIAAVFDQSQSRILLELSGPNARDALAKGVPIDLDANIFKPGHAAQTAASHIGLQITLLDDTPTFGLITAASTAGSFWSWLIASAAEYSIDIPTYA